MKPVYLKSNIDAYKGLFPLTFKTPDVPRVGDMVSIADDSRLKYEWLPTMLEVKRVIWYEDSVEVDLHYSEIQAKSLKLSGHNMFP
jgi:hypothetical protein